MTVDNPCKHVATFLPGVCPVHVWSCVVVDAQFLDCACAERSWVYCARCGAGATAWLAVHDRA